MITVVDKLNILDKSVYEQGRFNLHDLSLHNAAVKDSLWYGAIMRVDEVANLVEDAVPEDILGEIK